jgi:alkylated DNA nucleotide flippase Atl1
MVTFDRPEDRSMRTVIAAVVTLFLFAAVPLQGWGFDVHRYITRRALENLPPELRPFFAVQREFIVEHSVDPDLWRAVGLRGELGEEDPNHFLDLDGLDDARPFANVPREWQAYVGKYGIERVNRMGRLPWRTEEIHRLLVARFRDLAKPNPGYAADNARYLAAVLAHYVEDAHVPFHAVVNYDGQLTGQRGIHSRFETEAVLRNISNKTLKLAPVTIRPIPNIRDFVFETLIESESLVAAVLEADRKATEGREFYDNGYYATFTNGVRPILEKRVSDAASGVGSAIVSAWVEAGKPALPVNVVRPPARIVR